MEAFFKIKYTNLSLMYVWGHSYEFPADDNWDLMDKFGILMSTRSDVWHATNIQIVDYLNALRHVKVAMNGKTIFNPSSQEVWMTINGDARKIPVGVSSL
jgi:hypothetical protein